MRKESDCEVGSRLVERINTDNKSGPVELIVLVWKNDRDRANRKRVWQIRASSLSLDAIVISRWQASIFVRNHLAFVSHAAEKLRQLVLKKHLSLFLSTL